MYSTEALTPKLNGSSVTATQSSRVGHLTAVDTNVRLSQDTDCQHVASFTESDGVIVHPSVGVAVRGVASGDSAGESGGVSHHNPCESCCDLHLWWYCSGEIVENSLDNVNANQITFVRLCTIYGGFNNRIRSLIILAFLAIVQQWRGLKM